MNAVVLMNKQQTEDLKAFENRLIECVTHVGRKTRVWKVLCATLSTFASLWAWIQDGSSYSSYMEMIQTHWWLVTNLLFMVVLYLLGACDKYSAPKLISKRCKAVLHDYNMSCDERGKLILKKSKRQSQPLSRDWKNTTPG
ncbi:nuclear envelope phosphatase-regulatory subunit 1-like isoform X2 [Dysidea avara]|uniref:nuclear envelope phosphatase-regulatory subunit 1-like isoform X2 n=1 Tax=Dysidea avara TaxID=196820 RepID=UPI003318FDC1